MDYIQRVEAEKTVKRAIDDYLPIESLQEMLDIIYGSEFLVIEDGDMPESDEE